MKVLEKGHITDSVLEDYSLDHLAEPELEIVEEHILICPTCQDRLQEIDDFVRAFRMAHEELAAAENGSGGTRIVQFGDDFFTEPAAPMFAPPSEWTPAAVWFQRPVVWAGLALAVGLVALVSTWRGRSTNDSQRADPVISLVAQRGAAGVAEAHEGRLALQLDLRGVNDDPLVIEVATWDGHPVWRRTVGLAEAVARVAPDVDFTAGQYWIRVRAQRDPALLREFGLKIVK